MTRAIQLTDSVWASRDHIVQVYLKDLSMHGQGFLIVVVMTKGPDVCISKDWKEDALALIWQLMQDFEWKGQK